MNPTTSTPSPQGGAQPAPRRLPYSQNDAANRYRHAYRVAGAIVMMGQVVKPVFYSS